MTQPAHDYARVDEHVPVTRRAETANPYPPILIPLTLLATLGILRYAAFLLAPGNRGDLLPFLVVVAAERILMVHALLAIWTILTATRDPAILHYWAKTSIYDPKTASVGSRAARGSGRSGSTGREVGVDVFITVYGEDRSRSGAPRPPRSPCTASTAPGCWTTAGRTR